MRSSLRLALCCLVAATGLAVVATAGAQGRIEETVECDGATLTILVQPSSSETGWGAVQVVGDGTLIPLSFSFSAFDETTGEPLFPTQTDQKGSGNPPPGLAGAVTTCSQTFTAPLSELLEPGEEPPPGVDPSDIITISLTATVVRRP